MTFTPLRKSTEVVRAEVGGRPVLVSRTDHRHALIYWHGFPGPFDDRSDGVVRIADQVFDLVRSDRDFYYPLYTDVASGPFDFHASVAAGRRVLNFVRRRKTYESITVVGQSWGAVIALNGHDPDAVAKTILITPFLGIPTGEAAKRVLAHYAASYPEVLPQARGEYLAQIERIALEANPAAALGRSTGPLTIFAADRDQVVPLRVVEAMRPPQSELIVLTDQTHEVDDRAGFGKLFGDALGR